MEKWRILSPDTGPFEGNPIGFNLEQRRHTRRLFNALQPERRETFVQEPLPHEGQSRGRNRVTRVRG